MTLARGSEAITAVTVTMYKYVPVVFGAIAIDDDALRDTAEAVRIAEQSGNDFTLGFARFTRGLAMIHHGGTAGTDEGRGSPCWPTSASRLHKNGSA